MVVVSKKVATTTILILLQITEFKKTGSKNLFKKPFLYHSVYSQFSPSWYFAYLSFEICFLCPCMYSYVVRAVLLFLSYVVLFQCVKKLAF